MHDALDDDQDDFGIGSTVACPMCGGRNAATADRCTNCGETINEDPRVTSIKQKLHRELRALLVFWSALAAVLAAVAVFLAAWGEPIDYAVIQLLFEGRNTVASLFGLCSIALAALIVPASRRHRNAIRGANLLTLLAAILCTVTVCLIPLTILLGLAVAQGKRVTEYIDYLDEIPNEP